MKRKLVLIGNSGTGKTTIADKIVSSPDSSMDRQFGKRCPSVAEALEWMSDGTDSPVIACRADERLLWELTLLRRGVHPDDDVKQKWQARLEEFFFVFLYNSDPASRLKRLVDDRSKKLDQHLSQPDKRWTAQELRGNGLDVLLNPPAFDVVYENVFRNLADISIDTRRFDVLQATQIVQSIASAIGVFIH